MGGCEGKSSLASETLCTPGTTGGLSTCAFSLQTRLIRARCILRMDQRLGGGCNNWQWSIQPLLQLSPMAGEEPALGMLKGCAHAGLC